jgi:putative tryptophan/tyrosine transport system substrate-binding protein
MPIARIRSRLRRALPAGAVARSFLLFAWLLVAICSSAVRAATHPIAVVYPDIDEPYRSVFTKIIEGIEDQAKSRVASFAVGPNLSVQTLRAELKKQDVRTVIALGRNGLKSALELEPPINVIAGGVVGLPDADPRLHTVLSLAPDPALLFERLKTLQPSVRRVTVVYDNQQNGWLIQLARDAAKAQGLDLVAHEAPDLKSALKLYQDTLAKADGKRDAIWLPQDSTTVDESTVLPLVLQEAWNRSIPVFSSNVSHVRRGALFALYPNNLELGKSLAASAIAAAAGSATTPVTSGSPRRVRALKDVQAAINTRTAGHLGIAVSPERQQGFNLFFPGP